MVSSACGIGSVQFCYSGGQAADRACRERQVGSGQRNGHGVHIVGFVCLPLVVVAVGDEEQVLVAGLEVAEPDARRLDVIGAAAQCRVPKPFDKVIPSAVVSMNMHAATATPSRPMIKAPSSWAMSLICSRTLRSRMSFSGRL